MEGEKRVGAELEPVEAEIVHYDEAQEERDQGLSSETIEDLNRASASNTERAYGRWWAMARAWCEAESRTQLPMTPQTLTEFVGHLTRTPSKTTGRPYSPNSIDQAIAAIRVAHFRAGFESQPHTKAALALLKVYRRDRAAAGWRSRQAPPITMERLRLMLRVCDPTTAVGQRDAAILITGYGMMGRRSELSALLIEDTVMGPDWITIHLPMSKTDQAAHGEDTEVPRALAPDIDSVAILSRWTETLTAHGITSGPLIRKVHNTGKPLDGLTGQTISNRTRHIARLAGLTDADQVTAHGLRAGAPTDAAERGVAPVFIARHGRWSEKSTQVLTYIRPMDKRRNNPLLGGS